MRYAARWLILIAVCSATASAQTLIFFEGGFPSEDSFAPSREALAKALPGATFCDAANLSTQLPALETKLLVLPYGSAFPEGDWPAIYAYLQRGGNLLVLGGKPFSRAAYMQDGKWIVREESVRFTRPLLINGYSEVSVLFHEHLSPNPTVALDLPQFPIERAFSPIVRLSTKDLYSTEGSAGSLDARLDPIEVVVHNGERVAVPVIAIDHLRSIFPGGRWVFLLTETRREFLDSPEGRKLISALAAYALRGAEEFSARPTRAAFLPGEPIDLHLTSQAKDLSPAARAVFSLEGNEPYAKPVPTSSLTSASVTLPPVSQTGLHRLETRFIDGNRVLRVDRSAFWIRDDRALNSGARLTVGPDFFQLDGKPAAILGTTYMASDVQRLFLLQPNVAVWDHDMLEIENSGLNMVRTGLWSGWRDVTNDDGTAKDVFLRNLEAYLLTARQHHLQVQFTFFSFLPEAFGGSNPYLDPVSIEHQKTFVRSIVQRFKDVPYLSYDIINEPSISQFTWRTRPNGDKFELAAWNEWLHRRYSDWSALAEAWNMPALGEVVPLPTMEEFAPRGAYFGSNGLRANDYYLFAQNLFADWTHIMVSTIRDTGSRQLVTVGQDDGGYQERLNPAFFSDAIDFTSDHTWWLNDGLLWCSLIAKQPGKPMLIQETGLQRQLTPRETMRLTPEDEAALLERKLAMSFAGGAGAVEWLWNVNAYMTSDNEVTIGAVRADGSVKPDVHVLRGFARFAADASPYLHDVEAPQVAIVTSQALQYSPWNSTANEAQQRAVRALFYNARVAAYIVPENRLDHLGQPRLVILPSPQTLSEPAWQRLLQYVRAGGHLLITGSVDRDEHWRRIARADSVGLRAGAAPLSFHTAKVQIADVNANFEFREPAQEQLEYLAFEDAADSESIDVGKGNIIWIAYPIELSQNLDQVAKVYRYAAARAGIVDRFALGQPISSGILIYLQQMKDATLYIFSSESANLETIDLKDSETGAHLGFNLSSQRAAAALIRRSDSKIVARYGF